ncbi:hypothetical protein D3C87_1671600 [compost metagenome]
MFGRKSLHLCYYAVFQMQGFQLMLCKERLQYIVAMFRFPFILRICTCHNTQQGRFTFTIGTNQGYFITFFNDPLRIS